MSMITRVRRNVTRGRLRTIGVALAVGVALSAFLILSEINAGVSSNVAAARAAVQDIVTVQQAGSSGFSFSGHVSPSIVPTVRTAPDVVSVQRILLEAPGFTPGNSSGGGRGNFTLFEGIDTTSPISSFGGFGGGSGLSIVSGRTLDAGDENAQVAIIGQQYAATYGKVPGSTIDVNGTGMRVVGVFSTGTSFGDRNVILPFPAAAGTFAQPDPNLLYVTVGAAGDVNGVLSDLRSALGSSYDVSAPSQDSGGAFGDAIDSILSSTQFESLAALGIGAAVMVLVMVLVTAHRTREIGLLKAFGFSNGKILAQLTVEGLVLSLLGLPVGLVATVWLGPTVAQWVAGQAVSSTGAGGRFFGGGGFANRLVGSVSFNITPQVLLLGVAVTFGFGLIGSLYPILRALLLRPAEALRRE